MTEILGIVREQSASAVSKVDLRAIGLAYCKCIRHETSIDDNKKTENLAESESETEIRSGVRAVCISE